MAAYKDQLLSRLVRDGWEQVETVDLAAWWAADCWRLRSTRQAYGLELFVTFLVDPLWDGARTGARPHVWAVVATTTMPESCSPANAVALLSMNKGKFAVKLQGFVAAVLAYRLAGRRTGSHVTRVISLLRAIWEFAWQTNTFAS